MQVVPRIGTGIPLVGRAAELSALRTALATAAGGQANAVLLAGDAGVGKSRLLTELVMAAKSTGTTVFTGRCLDVGEAGLPYLPFVEALGQLTPAHRATAANRPVLSRLLPGLPPAEPPDSGDSAMEQLRLFDAVHGLFSDLATENPVLLAFEDLHWADASTRDLVRFLVSRLDTQRILMVCTYRQDDLHRRHPLRSLLSELTRLPTVDSLDLSPFDRAGAIEFVHALTDGGLPPEAISTIAERSQGNAFFCEELTASYNDSSGLPTGLAELLLARAERLSADARKVVRATSVASRAVGHASLAAVSGLADDALEEALREAVQLNILTTLDGCYAVRHALMRDAIYGDLLPGERVRLHAGYAKVVSSQAMLAYHSFRSHDLPSALTASVRAAAEAGRMGAPGEKLRHVEQALELWNAVPDPESSGVDELTLLQMATQAASAAGEHARAADFGRSVVVMADELDDPELSAEARHQLALALLSLEDRGYDIDELVQQAWQLVRERPASVVRAKVLALRARTWVWNWSLKLDIGVLQDFAKAAIADAREVGATDVEVDALVTLAVFADWLGHFEESLEVGRVAAERAALIGAIDVELRAHKNVAVVLAEHGRPAEAIKLCAYARKRAKDSGLQLALSGVDIAMDLIFFQYYTGDWADALASAQISDAPAVVRARLTAPTLIVHAARGDFDRVDELAVEIARLTDDALAHVLAGLGIAEAALWRGQPHEAVAEIEKVFNAIHTLSRASPNDALTAACLGVWALGDIATQARTRGDTAAEQEAFAAAERFVAQVESNRPRVRLGTSLYEQGQPQVQEFLDRLAAHLQRLKGPDDPELWRAAADTTTAPYWQAVARWHGASAFLAAGNRAQAITELLAAYEIATRLDAIPLRDAIVALARRGRITLPGNEIEPDSGSELTPRELAVLELVAAGMTNKQVGQQLYISQKTASVHLSRVMAKLGATNRTEVVSIAHDRGLLAR